jgi:hypothetical protein
MQAPPRLASTHHPDMQTDAGAIPDRAVISKRKRGNFTSGKVDCILANQIQHRTTLVIRSSVPYLDHVAFPRNRNMISFFCYRMMFPQNRFPLLRIVL